MKSYYVYLIRHGLTSANLEGRYIGHTDVELSEEGRAQVEELARKFIYPQPTVVFSSPLKRCTETAKILYPDKDPLLIDGLIEYNFGEFEGKTAEELKDYPMFPKWLEGQNVEAPFGESDAEFGRRITDCFIKIINGLIKTGTNKVAIVTHAGIISALLEAFGLPQAPKHEWTPYGGCGYTIRISPSLWMRGNKFEVVEQLPIIPDEEEDSDSEY